MVGPPPGAKAHDEQAEERRNRRPGGCRQPRRRAAATLLLGDPGRETGLVAGGGVAVDDALGGHLVDERLRTASGRLRRGLVGAADGLAELLRPVRSFERSCRLASRRLSSAGAPSAPTCFALPQLSSLVGNGQTSTLLRTCRGTGQVRRISGGRRPPGSRRPWAGRSNSAWKSSRSLPRSTCR